MMQVTVPREVSGWEHLTRVCLQWQPLLREAQARKHPFKWFLNLSDHLEYFWGRLGNITLSNSQET